MTATKPTTKTKRQADPDVTRLRAVKEAARKYAGASRARDKAVQHEIDAKKAFEALLAAAPEGQRDYLRSVAGMPREKTT